MKYTALLGVLVASVSVASAATVTSGNDISGGDIQAGNARAFFDTSGTALSGGYVGIGFFSTLPNFATETGAVIESSFNQLGAAGSFNFSLGGTPVPGIYTHSASGPIIDGGQGSEFVGQDIYLVVGNGSSIGGSSELFVLNSGTSFGADNPTFNAEVVLAETTPGTVEYGSDDFSGGTISTSAGDFGSASDSFQTAVLIPEPSTALLGLLGFLGVMRRRR